MKAVQAFVMASVFLLLLLTVQPVAHAQRDASDQRAAAQTLLEALAIQALVSDSGLPRSIVCARLSKAGLTLSEYWKTHCAIKVPPPGVTNCLKGFFTCIRNEGMPKPSWPEGASFDCENRLKACQAKVK